MKKVLKSRFRLPPDQYRCAGCGGVFRKAVSDEEARAEEKETFGSNEEDSELVCEKCFDAIEAINERAVRGQKENERQAVIDEMLAKDGTDADGTSLACLPYSAAEAEKYVRRILEEGRFLTLNEMMGEVMRETKGQQNPIFVSKRLSEARKKIYIERAQAKEAAEAAENKDVSQ